MWEVMVSTSKNIEWFDMELPTKAEITNITCLNGKNLAKILFGKKISHQVKI